MATSGQAEEEEEEEKMLRRMPAAPQLFGNPLFMLSYLDAG
jgi:hypothetical protein